LCPSEYHFADLRHAALCKNISGIILFLRWIDSKTKARAFSSHVGFVALGVPLQFVGGETLKVLGLLSAKAYVGFFASVAAVSCTTSAIAQTSSPTQGSGVSLPPVTITAPKRHAQSSNASRRERAAAHANRQATNRPSRGTDAAPRPETVASRGSFQQGDGPIQGYVAHRTLVGSAGPSSSCG
jgi:hypothetical protein